MNNHLATLPIYYQNIRESWRPKMQSDQHYIKVFINYDVYIYI